VRQRRILELNAAHPLVRGLRERFDADPSDPVVGDYAQLLLGWSLLAEGSEPHDAARFTALVAGLMESGLGAGSAPAGGAAPEKTPAVDAAPEEPAAGGETGEEEPVPSRE
jgi:molecular chaperone HtpG